MEPKLLRNSRTIASVQFEEESSTLDVWLRNGAGYRYFMVPRRVYEEFLEAESAGRFFVDHIRDRFAVTRLREKRL